MHVSRLRVLCIEVFRALRNLHPSFVQDVFRVKSSGYSLLGSSGLQHRGPNQVTFGSGSLPSLEPRVWDGLPDGMGSVERLNGFGCIIRKWDG